jgi:predicted lipase
MEPLCKKNGTIYLNLKWHGHGGKLWWFLNKLNTEPPYVPTYLLLGMYPKVLKNRCLSKSLYTNVNSYIIHNSPKW